MSITTGKGPPVWILDVDGVKAKFNESALLWLNMQREPRHRLFFDDPSGPTSWNWPREMFGRKEEDAFWEFVSAHPSWWANLEPYEDAGTFLRTLSHWQASRLVQPYFITSRPPNDAAFWTHYWLENWGMFQPNVLAVQPGKKHLVAEAIGASVLVDDYHKNFNKLPVYTRGYLIDRPWNRDKFVPGATRVKSLQEVWDLEVAHKERSTHVLEK